MTPPDPARAARLTAALADANQQLEQAEQQRDAAHAALTRYCAHFFTCPAILGHPCTCGLDAALAASAPQKPVGDYMNCPCPLCAKPPAPAQETERGR
jgi:hypothetical protein